MIYAKRKNLCYGAKELHNHSLKMSSVSIHDLPPEILQTIFEYLLPEELIIVQNVCSEWKEFARSSSVWDEFVYSPDEDTTTEDMITFLEKCPMLKHINTSFMPDKDKFIPAIIKYCFDIHTFFVEFMPTLSVSQIDALFEAFPNLNSFKIRVESPDASQIVARVSKCTKLKQLILSGQYCSDGVFKPIVDGCISLEYLSFNGGFPNVSKKDILYVLKNMNERLLILKFGISPTTQEIVNLLASFTKLEKLSLHNATHGQTVDFSSLAKIKTLRELNLESFASDKNELCRFLDFLFLEPLPRLEKLDICFYDFEYDKYFMGKICKCYPNLKHLRLYGRHPEDIRDGFKNLCKLEKLESLGFSSSDTITDDDIMQVGQCLKLKNLDLSFNSKLTDNTLVHISKCKRLESLDISYSSISGENLHLIADNLRRLKFLDVKQCKNLEETFVCALADKMPALKIITSGGVCFA